MMWQNARRRTFSHIVAFRSLIKSFRVPKNLRLATEKNRKNFRTAAVALTSIILLTGVAIIYTTINSRAAPGDCTTATNLCVETITPDYGLTTGGTTVTIAGANLAQLEMPVFTQISSGYETTCGIAADGYTYCWGRGANGRLGNGGTGDSITPVKVQNGGTTDGKFSQISSGHFVSCGIGAADGWVYCWGENAWGTLGSTVGTDATTPRAIAQGQIPSGVTATKLVVGEGQIHIIGSNGWIYGWGFNDPRIGDGGTGTRNTPVRLAQGALPGGEGSVTFTDVTSGYQHGCGIIDTGAAYCWGTGGSGRLGNGSSNNQNSPVAVSGGLTFSQISAGTSSTCAVSTAGQAYCWGLGDGGRLGTGNTNSTNVPTAVAQGAIPAGVKISQVSVSILDASGNTSCAIGNNGKAYCWGTEDQGEIGDGTAAATRLSPVAVIQGAMPANFTFREISTGADHVCAIGGDGSAYCWGYNTYGRLGDGTMTSRNSPVKVVKSSDMAAYAPYSVTLGGAECISPVITNTSITCTTPAHQAGPVDLVVSNGLNSNTRANALTYTLPSGVYDITPNKGTTAGGTAVTIYGADFRTIYQPTTGLVFPGGGNGQYIDTGVTQLGNNKKVEFQFSLDAAAVASTATNRIFGSFGSAWDNNSYALSKLSSSESSNYGNNQFVVRVGGDPAQNQGNANGTIFLGAKDTAVHTWIQDIKTVYWDNPTTARTTLSDSNLSSSNGNTMYVGNIHYNGGLASSGIGGQPFSGTVYYLKIWDGGTLVRDFIPVKRNLDGVCGLWDRQNSVFYKNAGVGALTCTIDPNADPITPAGVTTVSFDGLPATNVVVSGDGTMITANTPAHPTEMVDVVITVDGLPITLPNSYSYVPAIASIDPKMGPISGGTGFGASYNHNGAITITGDGFMNTPPIDASYINTNKTTWNPVTFSGYTSADPYGGTITYGGDPYNTTRLPWRVYDKGGDNSTNVWQVSCPGTAICATGDYYVTWTLPVGKYVNLSTIYGTNGYWTPARQLEFYAGTINDLSLTGTFTTTDANDYRKQYVPILPANQDIWTNVITVRMQGPPWANAVTGSSSALSLQEVLYTGYKIDLTGQVRGDNYPVYFSISDLNTIAADSVQIDGQDCPIQSATNTTITCIPPAHAAGTVDVVVTVDGISSTFAASATDDDYTYIPPPTITAITPDHGPITGGTEVTITGTNFATPLFDQIMAMVHHFNAFNGANYTLNSETDWQEFCLVATNSGNGCTLSSGYAFTPANVMAWAYDTSWWNAEFSYTINNIDDYIAANPNVVDFGGATSLSQWYAQQNYTVTFDIGGTPAVCVNVVVVNNTTITCTTSAHSAGLVDVTISGPTGSGILADAYTYEELYIALSADKVTAVMNPSPTANAGEAFDSVDLMTSTNFQNGYRLSISATEPALVCASGPRIEPLLVTGSLAVDKWGYGLGSVSAASGVWKGVTTAPVQFDSHDSAVDLPDHRDSYLWFGVKINAATPACTYVTTVTILAQGAI